MLKAKVLACTAVEKPILPGETGCWPEGLCLAGAMDIALGSGATGVFTNSSWLWNKLFEVRITKKHLNYGGDFIPLALEKHIESSLWNHFKDNSTT